jgi:hypothetical protein
VRETIRAAQWCAANGTELTTFWTGQAPFRVNRYVREFYGRLTAEAGAQVIESAPEKLAGLVIAAYERGRPAPGAWTAARVREEAETNETSGDGS